MSNIEDSFSNFKKAFDKIGVSIHQGQKILAEHGWYLSEDMEINVALGANNLPENIINEVLDSKMVDYYSTNLKLLTDKICSKYPDRAEILKEAYQVHDKGYYFASTSLYLAQADGILNGLLFKTRSKKKDLKKFLKESYPSGQIPGMIRILTKKSSIDSYHKNNQNYKNDLNRHAVVHGFDTDYGTFINSLKAFSILAFEATLTNRNLKTDANKG